MQTCSVGRRARVVVVRSKLKSAGLMHLHQVKLLSKLNHAYCGFCFRYFDTLVLIPVTSTVYPMFWGKASHAKVTVEFRGYLFKHDRGLSLKATVIRFFKYRWPNLTSKYYKWYWRSDYFTDNVLPWGINSLWLDGRSPDSLFLQFTS